MRESLNFTPGSPFEWYDLGVSYRQQGRFGEAINAFSNAISAAETILGSLPASDSAAADLLGSAVADSAADLLGSADRREALEHILASSNASIELLREITGFANTDLMNP